MEYMEMSKSIWNYPSVQAAQAIAMERCSLQAAQAAIKAAQEPLTVFMNDSFAKNEKVTTDAKQVYALNNSPVFWSILISWLAESGLESKPSKAVQHVWDFKKIHSRTCGNDYLAAKAQPKLLLTASALLVGDRPAFITDNYFTTRIVMLAELLGQDSVANADVYAVYSAGSDIVRKFEQRVTDVETRKALQQAASKYSPATASTQRVTSANALMALGMVVNNTLGRCIDINKTSPAWQKISDFILG